MCTKTFCWCWIGCAEQIQRGKKRFTCLFKSKLIKKKKARSHIRRKHSRFEYLRLCTFVDFCYLAAFFGIGFRRRFTRMMRIKWYSFHLSAFRCIFFVCNSLSQTKNPKRIKVHSSKPNSIYSTTEELDSRILT